MSTSVVIDALWAFLAVSVLLLEGTARLTSRRVAPFGAVVRSIVTRAWLRVLLVLAWMWLGWHLFAR